MNVLLYPSGPAPGASLSVGGAIEALVGETIEVRSDGQVTALTAKVNPGSGASISTATITFNAAGRYEFDVVTTTGRGHFYVTCCEVACLTKLPAGDSATEKRMTLRGLATRPWFSGLASELVNRDLRS
jgi:hypothetical protein